MEWRGVSRSGNISGRCHAQEYWNELREAFRDRLAGADFRGAAARICVIAGRQKEDRSSAATLRCDHVGVMLHLRSLYVSKAAILTISACSVPVENRSPA